MPGRYYQLVFNAEESSADLYIFGDITSEFSRKLWEDFLGDVGDVSSLSIVKDLQELDAEVINVHINSNGGYVSEGLAIYNALKNHPAKIVTICDGFACSAASVIFMAGDERVMNSASMLMIHNAWSDARGNAAQLRNRADELEKISLASVNAYAAKCTISREEVIKLMDGTDHEGTWILPEEALEWGFATEVVGSTMDEANQSASHSIIEMVRQQRLQRSDATPVNHSTLDGLMDVISEMKQSIADMKEMFTVNEDVKPEPVRTSLASKIFAMKGEK